MGLKAYQTQMIEGIIDIKTKRVETIMIRSNKMISIDIKQQMNNATAKRINKFGFSRIPVFS